LLRPKNVALVLYLTRTHGNPAMGMGAISCMLAVVRWQLLSFRSLGHAGTAEPLRVSPPEAVAYLLELLRRL